ncbi:integrase [Catenulispora sp. GP43]|uniref:tyrosine-type recombinase/integrase n=1 Tax=Catenulispora sp. GP43 TaxID=3156263 RepID=UPI00351343F9
MTSLTMSSAGSDENLSGQMLFRDYVERTWLPGHVVEAITRQGYTYAMYRHIMPVFGGIRLADITKPMIRQWVADLIANGAQPPTINDLRMLLSAVFTTALEDGLVDVHPCKGVKVPHVPSQPRRIVTPEEFDRICRGIHNPEMQLLVETAVETGLRWGELTELRVSDLTPKTRMLTVSRAVVWLARDFHPTGGHFLVKPYPKGKHYRRFKLSEEITKQLLAHIKALGLRPNDLIFAIRKSTLAKSRPQRPDPASLGLSDPALNGHRHWHGTTTCYANGCRCQHCRNACADYRAERRRQGKDHPRSPRKLDTDGHIPNRWFRSEIWLRAIEDADLGFHVRIHDLRHAHASWLLAGGASLQAVKERLGHTDIATTARYLHTLPDTDQTALDALDKIRRPKLPRDLGALGQR